MKILKWGNSCGIRLPAKMLKDTNMHIGDQFIIKPDRKGGFHLVPVKKTRDGWLEALNKIAEANQDESLMDEFNNEFDEDDWQW